MLVTAEVRPVGSKGSHSSTALADSGATMSLADGSFAKRIGVEYTGREINFVSVLGHTAKVSEAIVSELELEGEVLKYKPLAVAEIPKAVKKTLLKNELDENMLIGVDAIVFHLLTFFPREDETAAQIGPSLGLAYIDHFQPATYAALQAIPSTFQ